MSGRTPRLAPDFANATLRDWIIKLILELKDERNDAISANSICVLPCEIVSAKVMDRARLLSSSLIFKVTILSFKNYNIISLKLIAFFTMLIIY